MQDKIKTRTSADANLIAAAQIEASIEKFLMRMGIVVGEVENDVEHQSPSEQPKLQDQKYDELAAPISKAAERREHVSTWRDVSGLALAASFEKNSRQARTRTLVVIATLAVTPVVVLGMYYFSSLG